jgi:8-oxo-dGTP pyrophosphatase MutT (NUDIX family)
MTWYPHLTVAAVIEKEQRFLMVEERAAGQLVINQPAGHLEDRESIIDAVIRETYEETTWRFKPTHLIGVYHWQQPQNQRTYIRFCFCGELLEQDKNASLDPDIEQALWLSYAEVLQRQTQHRSPLVLSCINDYRAGHRHTLDLIHTRI